MPHELLLPSVAAVEANVLPSPEMLVALEGYKLLRINCNGWIVLSADGEQMWVEVERH